MSARIRINRKVEDAFAEVLAKRADLPSAVSIHNGFSGETLNTPYRFVICDRAQEDRNGNFTTGNWMVRVRVGVRTNFQDTVRDIHEEYVGALMDVLMNPELLSWLNGTSVDHFTVQRRDGGYEVSDNANEDQHQTEISGMFYVSNTRF